MLFNTLSLFVLALQVAGKPTFGLLFRKLHEMHNHGQHPASDSTSQYGAEKIQNSGGYTGSHDQQGSYNSDTTDTYQQSPNALPATPDNTDPVYEPVKPTTTDVLVEVTNSCTHSSSSTVILAVSSTPTPVSPPSPSYYPSSSSTSSIAANIAVETGTALPVIYSKSAAALSSSITSAFMLIISITFFSLL